MSTKEPAHSKNNDRAKPRLPQQEGQGYETPEQLLQPATLFYRARTDPSSLTPADVLHLQRTVGNRSVGRILHPVQRQQEGGAADQGGRADVTNLEQDMRDLLINWKEAATNGAELFADRELLAAISQGTSMESFLFTLIGNTTWAAAAFMPVGGPAFALSMAGIAIGSIPALTETEPDAAFLQVKEMCLNHIAWAYDQMNPLLRRKAAVLVRAHSGIRRYPALALFVQRSFRPGLYNEIDPSHNTPPTLNKPAITAKYDRFARRMLQYFKEFRASGTRTYRGRYFITRRARAARIGDRLAVLNFHGSGEMVTTRSRRSGGGGRGRPGGGTTTRRERRYHSQGVRITYVESGLEEAVIQIHRDRWHSEPRVYADEDEVRRIRLH